MAATLTLRSVKGSPLTNNEVDGNFTALNSEISTLETDLGTAETNISTLQTDLGTLENAVGATALEETIQDIIGTMVSSNTESGISVTYQDGDGTLDFDVADFTITLAGDLSGTGTVTNLGDVSITAAVADNSHSHTTGNITGLSEYIADTVGAMVTSNTESGITVAYQDGDNTLDFDVADFTITMTGDATGSGTVTNLGNVSIAMDVSSITGDLGVTGVVTATDFNSTSDVTLKENINLIDNPLEKISMLNGYTFNWINNKKEAVGIVAQEVEKVFPQIVSTGEDGLKRVSYDSLIPLLIESIKDLKNKLDNR